MHSYNRLRNLGWVILLSFVGASALSSCSSERPDFSPTGDGDGDMGGSPGDGDSGGETDGTSGDGDTSETSGDGDTSDTSGDGDMSSSSGDGDTSETSGDGDGDTTTSTSCDGIEVDGECILTCETEGEVRCEGTCIDPKTNADFCGATEACQDEGSACDSDESCVLGACRSWGEDEEVGPFLKAHAYGRIALGIDDDGNTVIAHPTGEGMLIVKRRAAGSSWSSAHTLDDDVSINNYSFPDLAVDADGNVLAMWLSGTGHGWARYRAQAESWGPSAALDLGTPEDGPSFASPAAMTAAPNGDVFIGFDNVFYGAGTEAWTRRFSFEADGWYSADRHDENGTEETSFGTLVVDGDSNVTATWTERVSATEHVARASHWNSTDNQWSAPVDLGDSPFRFQTGAADSDGNVALVFCHRSTGGKIVPHNYDRAKGSWTSDPALVDDSDAFNDNCMIASNPAGNMILSWEQSTPDGREILVSRRNPITRTWQGVTSIMDVLDGSAYPTIGMDGAGNAWVVANRHDADESEIIARRWNAESLEWEQEITIASAPAPAVLSQVEVAVSQSGSAVVVWSYKPDSDSASALWARIYE